MQHLFIYNFCRCLTCYSCFSSCPLSMNMKQMQHFKNSNMPFKNYLNSFFWSLTCMKQIEMTLTFDRWMIACSLVSKSCKTASAFWPILAKLFINKLMCERAYNTYICIHHPHMHTCPNEEKTLRFSWTFSSWLSYRKNTDCKWLKRYIYIWDCFKLQILRKEGIKLLKRIIFH